MAYSHQTHQVWILTGGIIVSCLIVILFSGFSLHESANALDSPNSALSSSTVTYLIFECISAAMAFFAGILTFLYYKVSDHKLSFLIGLSLISIAVIDGLTIVEIIQLKLDSVNDLLPIWGLSRSYFALSLLIFGIVLLSKDEHHQGIGPGWSKALITYFGFLIAGLVFLNLYASQELSSVGESISDYISIRAPFFLLPLIVFYLVFGLYLFLQKRDPNSIFVTISIFSLLGVLTQFYLLYKSPSFESYDFVTVLGFELIGYCIISFGCFYSLNKILKSPSRFSEDSEIKSDKLKHALRMLDQQKFALDQHAIVAITDVKGTITYVNDLFCDISGYGKDELIDQNHRLLNSGHHPKEFFRRMYLDISKGKVWHGEICNRNKTGELYWVETTITPFLDENGKPESYIAIRTDITASKAAEQKIKHSESELRQALKSLDQQKFALDQHAIVAITDVKGTITYVNELFCGISGYDQDELIGQNHRLLNSGHHPTDFFRNMYLEISKGKVWHGEICNKNKNGELYWVETTITPVLDEKGKPKSYIAIRTDITATKETEQKIKHSENELRQALKSLDQQKFALDQHAIVAITDVKGTITYVNDLFCGISGYEKDELIGQNHRLLNSGHHPTEFFRSMYLDISKGKVWHGEICNRNKSGDLYWVETTITPFLDDHGKPISYIAIRTDITASKAAEKKIYDYAASLEKSGIELTQAKERAENSAKAKSEFLANMSHEIRTPMNGVIGMLDLLIRSGLEGKQRHYTKLAQSSAEGLLTIINDILDFSKIEAGKLEIENIEFDVVNLLEDFCDVMAIRAEDKGLELILDIDKDLPQCIVGDSGRLQQLLTNLVGNALKFTEEGEVVLKARGINPSDASRAKLEFSVIDTGIGIAEDKLDKLFEAFSQEDASTTRRFGGTGLGLAISRQLTGLMGGELTVSSVKGEGSCFKFICDFPLAEDFHTEELPKLNLSGIRFLVVDDNSTNRALLNDLLQQEGAEVTTAVDAQHALRVLANRPSADFFKVALIDMQMPLINGASLGDLMHRDKSLINTSLVMMTSMLEQDGAKKMAEVGFGAYLTKPVKRSSLFKTLALILNGNPNQNGYEAIITDQSLQRFELHTSRILVVDDNPVNQEVALSNLEDLGLNGQTVGDGRQALEALASAPRSAPFELILMDCQMPVLDGYETTKIIRSGEGVPNANIPIIALTANAMKGDQEKCLQAGMDDYLSKPIDISKLQEKLRYWLNQPVKTDLENLSETSFPKESSNHLDNEVWDFQKILDRVGGKSDRIPKIVELFITSTEEQIQNMQTANDGEGLKQAAHAIKGSAGNLAANALMQAAYDLEIAAMSANASEKLILSDKVVESFNVLKPVLLEFTQKY